MNFSQSSQIPGSLTLDDSSTLYGVERWGAGYFGVNSAGLLTVSPSLAAGSALSIVDVVKTAQNQGLRLPLLIRFQDILRDRINSLNRAFSQAMKEYQYAGRYNGVYPIKVNQLREVVEEILEAGRPFDFGLEVGSKAELHAALAVDDNPEAVIVCNGYKDASYIQMALLGRKLDKRIFLVIEKVSELPKVLEIAQQMGVEPWIGIRIRLSTQGVGKWAASSGSTSKFGLTAWEMMEVAEILKAAEMSQALKLLHFHLGSQVPDILNIKAAVREATRYYVEFRKMGYPVQYLDVGGGLAVDYDGSRSSSDSSANYSMEQYCRDIVYNVKDVCDDGGVPHPELVSESGRALTAHHAVLVVDVWDTIQPWPESPRSSPHPTHKLVGEIEGIRKELRPENLAESWLDLVQVKEQSEKLFEVGLLDLPTRATLDILFWKTAKEIRDRASSSTGPETLEELDQLLAQRFICNFSVFQSLLDHWAAEQLFPVVPLQYLNDPPDAFGYLVDITCDSDGKVARFAGLSDSLLPLNSRCRRPYWLGIFLVGAYQDIMGDIHNLFGRVDEAHIYLDEDEEGGFFIEEKIQGSTLGEVLERTQYDSKDLVRRMRTLINGAIRNQQLKPSEGMRLLEEYRESLAGPTYLVGAHSTEEVLAQPSAKEADPALHR